MPHPGRGGERANAGFGLTELMGVWSSVKPNSASFYRIVTKQHQKKVVDIIRLMCYYGIRKRKEIQKMKLFCVLVIIVFVVVLSFYYTVMGVQTYNKVMKKYKKKS